MSKNSDKLSMAFLLLVLSTMNWSSCTKDISSTSEDILDPSKEIASDIEMTYSDSAQIKFRIEAPQLVKYEDKDALIEEFPQGLRIEFFDQNKEVISWVMAKYAMRNNKEGTMLLKDSVVLKNDRDDKIETNSILWDDLNQTLSTEKFVRIVQGESKDTLYGMGMKATTDFSRFEMKQFYSKRQSQNFSKEFGIDQ